MKKTVLKVKLTVVGAFCLFPAISFGVKNPPPFFFPENTLSIPTQADLEPNAQKINEEKFQSILNHLENTYQSRAIEREQKLFVIGNWKSDLVNAFADKKSIVEMDKTEILITKKANFLEK